MACHKESWGETESPGAGLSGLPSLPPLRRWCWLWLAKEFGTSLTDRGDIHLQFLRQTCKGLSDVEGLIFHMPSASMLFLLATVRSSLLWVECIPTTMKACLGFWFLDLERHSLFWYVLTFKSRHDNVAATGLKNLIASPAAIFKCLQPQEAQLGLYLELQIVTSCTTAMKIGTSVTPPSNCCSFMSVVVCAKGCTWWDLMTTMRMLEAMPAVGRSLAAKGRCYWCLWEPCGTHQN